MPGLFSICDMTSEAWIRQSDKQFNHQLSSAESSVQIFAVSCRGDRRSCRLWKVGLPKREDGQRTEGHLPPALRPWSLSSLQLAALLSAMDRPSLTREWEQVRARTPPQCERSGHTRALPRSTHLSLAHNASPALTSETCQAYPLGLHARELGALPPSPLLTTKVAPTAPPT